MTELYDIGSGSQSRPTIGADAAAEVGYRFDNFAFYPSQLSLHNGAEEIRLGSRACAILHELLKHSGSTVTKEELVLAAWPSMIVDEGNLRVHVAQLRKILGNGRESRGFITNVVGRGYQFTAPVSTISNGGGPQSSVSPGESADGHILLTLGSIIGRDHDIENAAALLRRERLVTLVGPGGVGKTTIAQQITGLLKGIFGADIFFVDLSDVTAVDRIPFAITSAIGLPTTESDQTAAIISFMRHKRALVVLDNCEHLIEGAAHVCESLLRMVPELRILATSREPMRAQGEWLFRVAPLGVPASDNITFAEAMNYPAVELFVHLAAANNQETSFDDDDVSHIIQICTRLDGVPLALEMAAARVESFGIQGLSRFLQKGLDVLTDGRRTSNIRHRTMRNSLEWSHAALTLEEKVVYRRLSVFPASFSLQAATCVCADEALSDEAVVEAVGALVRKSLIAPSGQKHVTYRMIGATRLFASEKAMENEDAQGLRRRHLAYTELELGEAQKDWAKMSRGAWLLRYAPLIEDVRGALAWAFSDEGEVRAGVKLTAAAIPLALQIGLADEFRTYANIALQWCSLFAEKELVAEMRLNMVFATLNPDLPQPLNQHTVGVARAAYLADLTGNDNHRIEAHVSLAPFYVRLGNYAAALDHAQLATNLALKTHDDLAILAARRVLSQAAHCSGELDQSTVLAKSVLSHPVVNIPFIYGGIQSDRNASMKVIIARTLWIQGQVDQAQSLAREIADTAISEGPLALCHALAFAVCPIYIWRGDDELAADAVERLCTESQSYGLPRWNSWGLLYREVIKQRTVRATEGIAFTIVPDGEFQAHTLATLNGQIATLDYSRKCPVGERAWCAPELMRLRAEELETEGNRRAATNAFRRSIEIAQKAGALSWELRTSLSLGKHLASEGKVDEALSLVSGVRKQFTEGFSTTGLREADAFTATTAEHENP